jgi:hypothetical protein
LKQKKGREKEVNDNCWQSRPHIVFKVGYSEDDSDSESGNVIVSQIPETHDFVVEYITTNAELLTTLGELIIKSLPPHSWFLRNEHAIRFTPEDQKSEIQDVAIGIGAQLREKGLRVKTVQIGKKLPSGDWLSVEAIDEGINDKLAKGQ